MTEKTTASVAEKTADTDPLLPRLLSRLGLYATYITAALLTLVIVGDLAVLARHTLLTGWLALLVGVGPLIALLLSTLASYINYYGVWRILRGKDEFDAGEDLKSHAADIPQAAQAMLAGRAGCLPVASAALLAFSLLLAVVTTLPPETPVLGELGAWNAHVGNLAFNAVPVTPTASPAPTATATPSLAAAAPTAMPTPTPTTTPTSKRSATPSPTATTPPVVIKFSITPTTAFWNCTNQGLEPGVQTITLDNSGSNVSVSWQATPIESAAGAPWAAITPSSGSIPAHSKRTITISPDPQGSSEVCLSSSANGTPWHVSIAARGAGTRTFTYTIYYSGLP